MEKPSLLLIGAGVGFVALVITRMLGLDWLSAIFLAGLLFAVSNIAEKDRDIKDLQEDRARLAAELHQLKVEYGLEKPFTPAQEEE